MAAEPGIPTGHVAALSFNCKDNYFTFLNCNNISCCCGAEVAHLVDITLKVVCVLMVCFHVLELLIDESAMPKGMEVRFIKSSQMQPHFPSRLFQTLSTFS